MNAPFSVAGLDALRAGFLARQHKLFIDGKWVDAQSGETIEVLDPATGGLLARVAAGGAADVELAVQAARRAFRSGPWSRMPAAERGRLIAKLADAVEAHADELALLESLDGGNPLKSVRHVDVAMAIGSLRWNAGWANRVTGDTPMSAAEAKGFSYSLREPIGVAGLITPWNAPFLMAVNKISPALAAGCTCVLKPAELAPLTALRLAELIAEVGIPEGVVNVVTGYGHTAGQALADHPEINKISFTGSTRVGKSILAASAATNLKRVTLELGGKSPVVVFADADIEKATAAIAQEIFFKTGQYCAAGTRLFVHRKVFDKVVEGIAALAKQVKVGPGTAPDTTMGPIISAKQLDRVVSYIEAGSSDGAEIVTGGKRIASDGYFIEPTLLANLKSDMSVVTDEIFGPVLCALPFDDESGLDKIVDMANDTPYGLAAKIWTRDLGTAHQMARKIQAGTIAVNGGGGEGPLPFGGFKQSGLGRENGKEGVLSYTEIKSVFVGY